MIAAVLGVEFYRPFAGGDGRVPLLDRQINPAQQAVRFRILGRTADLILEQGQSVIHPTLIEQLMGRLVSGSQRQNGHHREAEHWK